MFLFGTRLTNISRELKRRDVDEAMTRVSSAVKDWSGGTRIGGALKEFNYKWARRVLTQGAHVLIMTDGLDREDASLARHRNGAPQALGSAHHLAQPLLRYEGFEPRAAGIRAMMPYIDEFRPVHSLESLSDLAAALAAPRRAEHDPRQWLKAG